MATTTKSKTDRLLHEVLQEVREVRALVEPISHAYRASRVTKGTVKKLPTGLRQALREVREGKISGPFDTVDEFMAHLTKK